MIASKTRDYKTLFILFVVSAYIALFCVYPIGVLVVQTIFPSSGDFISLFNETLQEETVQKAIYNTLESSIISAFFSLIIGTTFALLITLSNIRHKTLLIFLLLIPMLIPAQITAVSWLELVSPSGPLSGIFAFFNLQGASNPLYSKEGVILLLSIEHSAMVFLAIRAGIYTIPSNIIEAARCSGANPIKIVFYVILPLLSPFLIVGLALAFVASIGNFGIPALLGIPGRYLVLSTLIYQRLSSFGPTVLESVGILSIVLIVIAIFGLLIQYIANRQNKTQITEGGKIESPFKLGKYKTIIEIASWFFLLFISILPLIALIKTSLIPALGMDFSISSITAENFIFALSNDVSSRAFINSTFLGFVTAFIVALFSVPFAYLSVVRKNKIANFLSMIADAPFALPGIVLSIACIMAFIRPIPIIDFSLYNTIWIILVAYLARFLAFGMRPVIASMVQLDKSLEEAGEIVGSDSFSRLRYIILPQILPSVMAGAVLVFMGAFNELTVSSLLWSVDNETLGVVIYNLYDEGNATGAAAVSVLTVIVTLIIVGILSFFARKLPKGTLPWQA